MAAEWGPDAVTAAFDVTPASTVDTADVLARTGPPGVVVHAAGQTVGSLDSLTVQQWHRQLDVNLTSIHSLNRHLWPAMLPGGGAIVLVASTASFAAFPQDADYVASKGAALALTKAMALDGALVGIRVNAVFPGFIRAPDLEGYFDAKEDPVAAADGAAAAAPLGRMGTPADVVADHVPGLADAQSITGASLLVDDGLMARGPTVSPGR